MAEKTPKRDLDPVKLTETLMKEGETSLGESDLKKLISLAKQLTEQSGAKKTLTTGGISEKIETSKGKEKGRLRKMRVTEVSDESSSSEDSDDEVYVKKTKINGRCLRNLPKGLSYDGKSNWFAFKRKFSMHAEANDWTQHECMYCLCMCLTGKAADFYATITERQEDLSYRQLMNRLEHRFGAKELSETAHARFVQATQSPDESLEEWADRVLTLATRAFRDLPEKHANQQAVTRFCQGLCDKVAGQDACVKRYQTMEEAMEHVKWFQHVSQAMYGKSKNSRFMHDCDEDERTAKVYQTSADSSEYVTRSDIEKIMKDFTEELREQLTIGNRRPEVNNQTSQKICFHCGQSGHTMVNCPKVSCCACNEKGHVMRDCGKISDYEEVSADVFEVSVVEQSLTRADMQKMVDELGSELKHEIGRTSSSRGQVQGSSWRECYQCGQVGHIKANCPRVKCFQCHKTGHLKRDCHEGNPGDESYSLICESARQQGNKPTKEVESFKRRRRRGRCPVTKMTDGPDKNCGGMCKAVAGQRKVHSSTQTANTLMDFCDTETLVNQHIEDSKAASDQVSGDDREGAESATVCQLSSASRYKINVTVGDRNVEAIVDTAAEVTIISEGVFKSLKKKPEVVKRVKLLTASKLAMDACIVGPVKLKIGSRVFKEKIHVAPISQDMLLGIDLLHSRAILDMRRGTMYIDGEEICLEVNQT